MVQRYGSRRRAGAHGIGEAFCGWYRTYPGEVLATHYGPRTVTGVLHDELPELAFSIGMGEPFECRVGSIGLWVELAYRGVPVDRIEGARPWRSRPFLQRRCRGVTQMPRLPPKAPTSTVFKSVFGAAAGVSEGDFYVLAHGREWDDAQSAKDPSHVESTWIFRFVDGIRRLVTRVPSRIDDLWLSPGGSCTRSARRAAC